MHRRTCRDRAIAHKNLSADSTPEGGEKHGGQNAEHARLPSVCGRGAPRGAPILIYPWETRDCYVQRECSPLSGSRSPRSRSTSDSCVFVKVSGNGGEGGIRTHGGSRLAGFQDRCFQPLSHLSKFKAPSPACWPDIESAQPPRGWDYSSLRSSPLRGRLRFAAALSRPASRGSARTHGGSRLAGFQDRCFQPLSHLSKFKAPSPAGERGIFGGQGYLISVGDDQIFPQQ